MTESDKDASRQFRIGPKSRAEGALKLVDHSALNTRHSCHRLDALNHCSDMAILAGGKKRKKSPYSSDFQCSRAGLVYGICMCQTKSRPKIGDCIPNGDRIPLSDLSLFYTGMFSVTGFL